METSEQDLIQVERQPRVEALVRQLSEVEDALRALLASDVDAMVDPVRETPVILRQAQAVLRRSEARARLLLDQVPALIWATDQDLRVTSIAGRELDTLREALDIPPEEASGHSLMNMVKELPELAGVLAAHYRALEGRTATYDATVGQRIFHGTVEPLRDATGCIVGCAGLGMDVTRQRRIGDVLRGKLDAARHKLETLAACSDTLPAEPRALVNQVLESSFVIVEELQIASEELYQQNEELVAMHNRLETSRRRYQDLFESAPDGYLVTDPAGIIQEANRAAANMLGAREDLLRGKPLVIYIAKGDRATLYRLLDRVQAEKALVSTEWEVRVQARATTDFPIFPAALTFSPMYDLGGEIMGLRWLLRDISASKRAEERNRLLEEVRVSAEQSQAANRLLRTVLDTMPVGVIICNAEGDLLMINPPGEEILGERVAGNVRHPQRAYTPHYPDGTPLPPSDMPLTQAVELGKTVRGMEILIRREDGTERILLVGAAPVRDHAGHIVSGVAVFQDITARQRAEAEIERLLAENRRQRTFLERLIEVTPLGVAVVQGLDFRFNMVNPAYCAAPELTPEDIVGQRFAEVFPDITDGGALVFMEEVYTTGERINIREYPILTGADEEETYWDIDIVPLEAVNEAEKQILIITREVTEQIAARQIIQDHAERLEQQVKRRAAALRASSARFRSIFEDAAIGIALLNQEGHVITGNPALQKILGYSTEELKGMSLATLTHPDHVGDDLALYQTLIAGEQPSYQMEGRYMHKDGHPIDVHVTVSLVQWRAASARFAIVMLEDISAQKQAQAALVQSEKLALTGQLAASLAHEINNPLQSVLGFMSLIAETLNETGAGADAQQLSVEEREEARAYAEIAIDEIKRAADLVNQMRDINRPTQAHAKEPCDANTLVERVLTLSWKKCQQQYVEVVWEPEDGLPLIAAVPARLQQVFLNLTLNALDAMPDGGTLHISTTRTQIPPGIEIQFSDSGEGMAPEQLINLFEPFHTTKSTGMGLGLYVTHKIIQEHKGRIEAESVEGEGATFTIWLPEG